MKKCEAYISYKDQFLQIEEIGGIYDNIMFFNPDYDQKGVKNYKMHLAERLLLKFEGSNELVSIIEVEEEFEITDSLGNVIFNSNNPNANKLLKLFIIRILQKIKILFTRYFISIMFKQYSSAQVSNNRRS